MMMGILDLHELARKLKEEGYDPNADVEGYCDGYADYEGDNFYSDADDKMSMSVETVTKNAEFLADEKEKSSISGAIMDAQSYWQYYSSDDEKVIMDIECEASEENMATEGKKKEKRKLQEDGVESELEQEDGIETAIEVKKKRDSVCASDV